MSDIESILREEFESIKEDIIDLHAQLGMRASGKSAESLEVVSEGKNVKLLGNSNFEQLEYGRNPTSSGAGEANPPLIEMIKDWIKDKGIVSDIKNDNDNSTLAFLITRKIHREGWDRAKYGGVELVSKVITSQRISKIIDRVGASELESLVKNV